VHPAHGPAGAPDPDRALLAARASGLVPAGRPLLVMLSGGADSVCLLDVAAELGAAVRALHVNYGMRGADSEADERHCRALCGERGVPLIVECVELGAAAPGAPGNVQAEARARRYALAERHAGGDRYATAHTLSDQAETVLYRLAVSPGRRALMGMKAEQGRLVRPLLGATREETRAWCRARGLAWREDASNVDPRFARARVREEVLAVLRDLNPAAERAIAETAAQLRDEAEVLDSVVDEAVDRLGAPAVPLEVLRREPPALARLVLRRMAEAAAAGGPVALSRDEADRILELGTASGTASLDLGGGLRAVSEYGVLRMTRDGPPEPPGAVELAVPGAVRFGAWEVEVAPGDEGEAVVSAAALGGLVTVRAWRDGDRMRPAGLGGTKSLQDLFTDRKVPRELRRTLPIVEAGGEIAWVAGLAVGERFKANGEEVVSLSARRAG
jgi:tRNA(Ile)-lysidine synthase